MRAKLGDVVSVEWFDAWCDQGQTRVADWANDCPVTTYGVLMRRGLVVTVVSEELPDGEYRTSTHIPAAMVKRIRRVA